MKIYRHSIHFILFLALVTSPMLSLVSTSASASEMPACYKNVDQKAVQGSAIAGQIHNAGEDSASHDNCKDQCCTCFTFVKLPANQVRLDGPVFSLSTYIQARFYSFKNISPRHEIRPPRLV